MAKVTPIAFDNFKNYIGKKVEVEITCYAGGIMYPDDNTLVGMNEGTYYFVSEIGTDDEHFWHHTIEKDGDPKQMSYIQVWDYEEYKAFYAQSDVPTTQQELEEKIQHTYGYRELIEYYPEVVKNEHLDTLVYDTDSLDRVKKLKNKYFIISEFVICAYLRDIEKDIANKINK